MTQTIAIQNYELFSNLSEEAAEHLHTILRQKHYDRDEPIIHQDEDGNSMFLIVSGRVKVVLWGDDGKEVILTTLKAGEFFGEMSLLDGQPRSATVTATEPTKLWKIERGDFMGLIAQHPEIGLSLMAEMSRRLRLADQNIQSLALLDVYGRVARALRVICREEGKQAGENVVIEQRPTHQELAARAGTSRETVSRIVGDLIRAGFMTVDGKRLIIHGEFLDDQESPL